MPRSPLSFRTERLLLRRFTPDDAEPLVALQGDVEYAVHREEWAAAR